MCSNTLVIIEWSWLCSLVEPWAPAFYKSPLTKISISSALPYPLGNLIFLIFLAAFDSVDHSTLKVFFQLLNFFSVSLSFFAQTLFLSSVPNGEAPECSILRPFFFFNQYSVISASTCIKTIYILMIPQSYSSISNLFLNTRPIWQLFLKIKRLLKFNISKQESLIVSPLKPTLLWVSHLYK